MDNLAAQEQEKQKQPIQPAATTEPSPAFLGGIAKKPALAAALLLLAALAAYLIFQGSTASQTLDAEIIETISNISRYAPEAKPPYFMQGYPLKGVFGLKCTVPLEKSLVNLAHVKKDGDNYSISCVYGPQYGRLLRKQMPNGTPYDGIAGEKIVSCTPETAKEMDEILKTPKKNEQILPSACKLHVQNSLPEGIDEYYFVRLSCAEIEKGSNYYENLSGPGILVYSTKQCFGELERINIGRVFVISADKKQVYSVS